jgi:U4/U6.U5 tri-snRNP component SNU23
MSSGADKEAAKGPYRKVYQSQVQEAGARSERVDVYEGLGQLKLVPGGAAVGIRGKGVGFYCEVCDLTFKDSLTYYDHLNSKQHLYNSGQKESGHRATLQEVRDRLEYLKHRAKEQSKPGDFDIHKRIQQFKERQAERKRQRKRATKSTSDNRAEDTADYVENDDMERLMGISGFGSTKR